MSRRQPLLMIAEPGQVSSGLQPDRHSILQPLWEEAENVRFWQGRVTRLVPASTAFVAVASPSRGLSQQQDSVGIRWLWHAAADGSIHRWFGPAAELVTTLAGFNLDQDSLAPATYVDFIHWGNWTLINSGLAAPVRYKPDEATVDTFGAPQAVKLLKKRNQLFALGTGLNQKQVTWSDADDITVYDAAADNLAGELPIEELDTGIRAGARLGDNIAVYGEDQLALVYWTGAPYYYGQAVRLDGIGAVGKMAVVADGPLNYGVGRNGIWRTDGNSFDYIDAGVLNGYLQENVNWGQSSKIMAFRNDVRRCLEFHFPMGLETEVSEAWSYDPATGGWGKALPFQVAAERRLLSKPIGSTGGTTYLLEDNPASAGALVLRTKPLLVQSGNGHPIRTASFIDEVELLCNAAHGVEFRYGAAERLDGPYEWTDWLEVDTSLLTHQPDTRVSGVFHKLEFRSIEDEWELDLQGFALYGQAEGVRDDRK